MPEGAQHDKLSDNIIDFFICEYRILGMTAD